MNESNRKANLLIAVGNSGRRDDGLGWAFAEQVEGSTRFEGDIEYRYQLQVEDAELISHYKKVIIVDAYRGDDRGPFFWERCNPKADFHFSTHAIDPHSIVSLCSQVYGKEPEVWLLGIAGKEWALQQGLSEEAVRNLRLALEGGMR